MSGGDGGGVSGVGGKRRQWGSPDDYPVADLRAASGTRVRSASSSAPHRTADLDARERGFSAYVSGANAGGTRGGGGGGGGGESSSASVGMLALQRKTWQPKTELVFRTEDGDAIVKTRAWLDDPDRDHHQHHEQLQRVDANDGRYHRDDCDTDHPAAVKEWFDVGGRGEGGEGGGQGESGDGGGGDTATAVLVGVNIAGDEALGAYFDDDEDDDETWRDDDETNEGEKGEAEEDSDSDGNTIISHAEDSPAAAAAANVLDGSVSFQNRPRRGRASPDEPDEPVAASVAAAVDTVENPTNLSVSYADDFDEDVEDEEEEEEEEVEIHREYTMGTQSEEEEGEEEERSEELPDELRAPTTPAPVRGTPARAAPSDDFLAGLGADSEKQDEEEETAYGDDEFEEIVEDADAGASSAGVLSPQDVSALRTSLAELRLGGVTRNARESGPAPGGRQSSGGGGGGIEAGPYGQTVRGGGGDIVVEDVEEEEDIVVEEDDDGGVEELDEKVGGVGGLREMVSETGLAAMGGGVVSIVSTRPGSAVVGRSGNRPGSARRVVVSRPLSAVRRKDPAAAVAAADVAREAFVGSTTTAAAAHAGNSREAALAPALAAVAAPAAVAAAAACEVARAMRAENERLAASAAASAAAAASVAASTRGAVSGTSEAASIGSATASASAAAAAAAAATEGRDLLHQLSARVSRLDERQQRYLLKVIGKLERAERAGVNLSVVFSGLELDLSGGTGLGGAGNDGIGAVMDAAAARAEARADAALETKQHRHHRAGAGGVDVVEGFDLSSSLSSAVVTSSSSSSPPHSSSPHITPDPDPVAASPRPPASSHAAAAAAAAAATAAATPPPPPLPTYPPGVVAVRVLRNWGSSRAVGLDGVELFASDGTRVIPPAGSVTLNWLDRPTPSAPSSAAAAASAAAASSGDVMVQPLTGHVRREGHRGTATRSVAELARLFGGGKRCSPPREEGKRSAEWTWTASLPAGEGLGRGVDLVLAPPSGLDDRPAVAHVRIWQLNAGGTDARRAGARTVQVVAPALTVDADGVVWSGELPQGTGFDDHAPHVVVNVSPGCEGTMPPLSLPPRDGGGGAAARKEAGARAATVEDSSSETAATVVERGSDDGNGDGGGRHGVDVDDGKVRDGEKGEGEEARGRMVLGLATRKELELEPPARSGGRREQQPRVASGRRAGSVTSQDLTRGEGSLLGLTVTSSEEAPAGDAGDARPDGASGVVDSHPDAPAVDRNFDSMLFAGTPRAVGRRVRPAGPLGHPRPAQAPVQASWDSLAKFTRNQAGRLGSSAFVYGDAADGVMGGGGGGGGGRVLVGRRAGVHVSVNESGLRGDAGDLAPSNLSSASASSRRTATRAPISEAATDDGGGSRGVGETSANVKESSDDDRGGGGGGGASAAAAMMEDSLTTMMHQPTAAAASSSSASSSKVSSGVVRGAVAVAAAALLAADASSAAAAADFTSFSPDPSWESFTIPERPRGQTLRIMVYSTWGDPHYVGLAGLDIFDAAGVLLTPSAPETQVVAEPSSVNVLDGYAGDPRTPDKLVDGVNLTGDDLHAWLAPFDPSPSGPAVTITVTLDEPATLGMIRLWNYNKSRIHSQRGVRGVEITLDDARVFCGEVRKAPGVLSEAVAAAECVLFDASETFLSALDRFDAEHYPQTGAFGEGDYNAAIAADEAAADAAAAVACAEGVGVVGIDAPLGKDGRPFTGVAASAATAAAAAPVSSEHFIVFGDGGDFTLPDS